VQDTAKDRSVGSWRVGQGYDIHRLEAGRKLILAGVEVPYSLGLAGHSDADVAYHAVIDAMLGAAGLEDIGTQFPDTDPAYRGIDSGELVTRAAAKVSAAGYGVVNVDVTVIAERPNLREYKPKMRKNLAAKLGVAADAVSVKAKTNEGLGEIGRGEAIACLATILLSKLLSAEADSFETF
jgi:2-C-methyl-D-erythritol 2,4-cyclodiphosphate synthase